MQNYAEYVKCDSIEKYKKKDKNTKDKEKQVYQRIQILEQKSIG